MSTQTGRKSLEWEGLTVSELASGASISLSVKWNGKTALPLTLSASHAYDSHLKCSRWRINVRNTHSFY